MCLNTSHIRYLPGSPDSKHTLGPRAAGLRQSDRVSDSRAGASRNRRRRLRPRRDALRILGLLLTAVPMSGTGAAAQPAPTEKPAVAVDTATLASGPPLALETRLEKTIFKVDVLTLRIRFGPTTTERLRRLAAEGPGDASADSIAHEALAATDVWARIRFERDVSLSQFLDGIMENLEKAREAGIVSIAEFERLDRDLPGWFGFLEERRIRDGDQLWYRIRGDELRTLFVDERGEVLLDQTDTGPGARLAVLGGYFAPGSDLREGLIRSLLRTVRDSNP